MRRSLISVASERGVVEYKFVGGAYLANVFSRLKHGFFIWKKKWYFTFKIFVNTGTNKKEEQRQCINFKMKSRWAVFWLLSGEFLQDSYDSYYDRRYDDGRDLFERRYSGMGAMRGGGGSGSGLGGGRDFGGMGSMGRREPLPPLPSLGRSGSGGGSLGSMRGSLSGGNGAGYDSMFSRRSPPRGGSNGMNRFG